MPLLIRTALPVAALAVTVLSATGASAWDRHSTVTGPHGKTISSHASGSCHGDECKGTQVLVGPNGKRLVRTGTTHCHADKCVSTVRITGPEGKTVTRTIKVDR